jgi:hypothetical protein
MLSFLSNNSTNLKSLIIPEIHIGDSCVKQLCAILRGDKVCSLKELDISWNQM